MVHAALNVKRKAGSGKIAIALEQLKGALLFALLKKNMRLKFYIRLIRQPLPSTEKPGKRAEQK